MMQKPLEATCQSLEAPNISPVETTGKHFPIPIGESSPLSELKARHITAFQFFIITLLQFRSNWKSGKTHKTTYQNLADLSKMSVRYIRGTLSELMEIGFIREKIGTSRYRIKQFICLSNEVPTDKNGNPLSVSIPRLLLEKVFKGYIPWKAAVVWICLKHYSDWKTGITLSLSINTLASWVRMSPKTVQDCIKALQKARLLDKSTGCKYQLYPKPSDTPKPVFRTDKSDPKAERTQEKWQQMHIDGDWRWSFNKLWRVNIKTCEIQRRKSKRRGVWRPLTLGDHIPKAIQDDFDLLIQLHAELEKQNIVTDTAGGVTDTAGGLFNDLFEVNNKQGS